MDGCAAGESTRRHGRHRSHTDSLQHLDRTGGTTMSVEFTDEALHAWAEHTRKPLDARRPFTDTVLASPLEAAQTIASLCEEILRVRDVARKIDEKTKELEEMIINWPPT